MSAGIQCDVWIRLVGDFIGPTPERMYFWMGITFLLGVSFLSMEGREFASMVAAGAGPSHSAFLSAFFTLVGTHGLHVSLGLVWLVVMLLQVATLGFQPMVEPALLLLRFVLARARHRLDWGIHHRLSGSEIMDMQVQAQGQAPGVDPREQHGARSYLIGLAYAVALTLASFWAATTSLVYAPAVPVLLATLAIAQMGVHVAFFLHISSAPDQANNFLALAFGRVCFGADHFWLDDDHGESQPQHDVHG